MTPRTHAITRFLEAALGRSALQAPISLKPVGEDLFKVTLTLHGEDLLHLGDLIDLGRVAEAEKIARGAQARGEVGS